MFFLFCFLFFACSCNEAIEHLFIFFLNCVLFLSNKKHFPSKNCKIHS